MFVPAIALVVTSALSIMIPSTFGYKSWLHAYPKLRILPRSQQDLASILPNIIPRGKRLAKIFQKLAKISLKMPTKILARSWHDHVQIEKDLGKTTQDLVTTIEDRTCHELAKYCSGSCQNNARSQRTPCVLLVLENRNLTRLEK